MTDEKQQGASLWEEFRRDFPPVWKAIPNKGLFVSLLVVWVLLFEFLGNSTFGYIDTHSLFAWTDYAYLSHEDDEHGFFMPFVVLFLFWWKRNDFVGIAARPWFPALAIIACSLILHVLGYVAQQTRVSLAAFFLGIYGLIGLTWGWTALKKSFFPMCLLAFALPLGTLAESLTFPLRLIAAKITAVTASTILGIDVIQQGTQIFDPKGNFQYEIAAACSGLRSLTAVLALCTIYAFLNFTSMPKRALMIMAAFPLALAGNISRLMLIIIVSEAFGQKYGEWVHDSSWFSMLPYIPPIVGILILGRLLREETTVSAPPRTPVEQPA